MNKDFFFLSRGGARLMASEVLHLHEWTTCTKYSSRGESGDKNSADYHLLTL